MKIFGIELFKVKRGNLLHENALKKMSECEYLPDFYPTQSNNQNDPVMLYAVTEADLLITAARVKAKNKGKKVYIFSFRPPDCLIHTMPFIICLCS